MGHNFLDNKSKSRLWSTRFEKIKLLIKLWRFLSVSLKLIMGNAIECDVLM